MAKTEGETPKGWPPQATMPEVIWLTFGDPNWWPTEEEGDIKYIRHDASDAEQLSELRKLAVEARDVLALLVPYGKIHTVEGVRYPDGSHSEAVDRGECVLSQLRAVLNPSHSQGETR